MSKTADAEIILRLKNDKLRKSLEEALKPEKKAVGQRARIMVRSEGNKVIVSVKARDVTSLRAALNSYCRWCLAAVTAIQSVEPLSNRKN